MVHHLGDGEKDALNARLLGHFNTFTEEQKQSFIMVSGMVAVLAYMDAIGERQLTRQDVVNLINDTADEAAIMPTILILCRSYGLPL